MKITKMKTIAILLLLLIGTAFSSCNEKPKEPKTEQKEKVMPMKHTSMGNDKRISLELNAMQKNHQLTIMRDHLDAVQNIVTLLAAKKYDEASELAYSRLGSTTEMKLMCSSFGDKNFEQIGFDFHAKADKMSEIFKTKDSEKSLEALANTMTSCVQCHATYRQ